MLRFASFRRRKNQQKKVVCHVAADGVSSDVWAWRKYGQKPIKGSPYPRYASRSPPNLSLVCFLTLFCQAKTSLCFALFL
jgi:hypothetical protein